LDERPVDPYQNGFKFAAVDHEHHGIAAQGAEADRIIIGVGSWSSKRGAEEHEQQARKTATKNVSGVRVSIPQLVLLIPPGARCNRPSLFVALQRVL